MNSRVPILLAITVCVLGTGIPAVTHAQGRPAACPPTIVIGDCDTGVPAFQPDGTCLQDLIDVCDAVIEPCDVEHRGDRMSCITGLREFLDHRELAAVIACAAQDRRPKCLELNVAPGVSGRYACVGANEACRASTELEKKLAKDAWQVACDKACKDLKCDEARQSCKRKTEPTGTVDTVVDDDNECRAANRDKPKGCYIQATGQCQCKCE